MTNLIEKWKGFDADEQQMVLLLVEIVSNSIGGVVMYRRYKKWGAPRWAARGLAGLGFQLSMLNTQRKIDRLRDGKEV
jgi:hypothetical protein